MHVSKRGRIIKGGALSDQSINQSIIAFEEYIPGVTQQTARNTASSGGAAKARARASRPPAPLARPLARGGSRLVALPALPGPAVRPDTQACGGGAQDWRRTC